MKILILAIPFLLFANSPDQIKYGEKTKVSNGFIIYVDKEITKDISSLKNYKDKIVKKIEMPIAYKKCISCHGSVGNKHALNLVPFLGGQNKIRIMKKLVAYRHGTYSQGFDSKSMIEATKNLTDNEIKEIALYLSQQKVPKEIEIKEDNKTKVIDKNFIN